MFHAFGRSFINCSSLWACHSDRRGSAFCWLGAKESLFNFWIKAKLNWWAGLNSLARDTISQKFKLVQSPKFDHVLFAYHFCAILCAVRFHEAQLNGLPLDSLALSVHDHRCSGQITRLHFLRRRKTSGR